MTITWKNVTAGNNQGANALLGNGAEQLTRALAGVGQTMNQIAAEREENGQLDLRRALAGTQSADDVNALLQQRGSQMNAATLDAVAKRQQLNAELANRAANTLGQQNENESYAARLGDQFATSAQQRASSAANVQLGQDTLAYNKQNNERDRGFKWHRAEQDHKNAINRQSLGFTQEMDKIGFQQGFTSAENSKDRDLTREGYSNAARVARIRASGSGRAPKLGGATTFRVTREAFEQEYPESQRTAENYARYIAANVEDNATANAMISRGKHWFHIADVDKGGKSSTGFKWDSPTVNNMVDLENEDNLEFLSTYKRAFEAGRGVLVSDKGTVGKKLTQDDFDDVIRYATEKDGAINVGKFHTQIMQTAGIPASESLRFNISVADINERNGVAPSTGQVVQSQAIKDALARAAKAKEENDPRNKGGYRVDAAFGNARGSDRGGNIAATKPVSPMGSYGYAGSDSGIYAASTKSRRNMGESQEVVSARRVVNEMEEKLKYAVTAKDKDLLAEALKDAQARLKAAKTSK